MGIKNCSRDAGGELKGFYSLFFEGIEKLCWYGDPPGWQLLVVLECYAESWGGGWMMADG